MIKLNLDRVPQMGSGLARSHFPCAHILAHGSSDPFSVSVDGRIVIVALYLDGVSSIRSNQGFILDFFKAGYWALGSGSDRTGRFDLAGCGPCGMLACGTKGGDGSGWWQAPVAWPFTSQASPPLPGRLV